MYNYEHAQSTVDPTDVLTEIIAVVADDLTNLGIEEFHDFRISPQAGKSTLSATVLDAQPFKTPFQFGPYIDILIDVNWPHDGSTAELRTAEHTLNAIYKRFWDLIIVHETPLWKEIYTARSSYFPAAPSDNAYIRRLFIFVRVKPN